MKKFLTLCAIVILMLVVTGCGSSKNKNYLNEITLDEYLEMISDNKTGVIYIDSNDDVSASLKKSLKNILTEEKVEIYYLDTTKFSSKDEEVIKFMNASDVTKDGYSVPMLVYVKNGKIKEYQIGYNNDNSIKTFIEDYAK